MSPSVDRCGFLAERVLERIRANPYARDVSVDAETVAKLVSHHYVSVEPWPFAALVDDH